MPELDMDPKAKGNAVEGPKDGGNKVTPKENSVPLVKAEDWTSPGGLEETPKSVKVTAKELAKDDLPAVPGPVKKATPAPKAAAKKATA